MKTPLLRIFMLILLLSGFANLRAQLADGTIAPDFTLTDLDGNTWNLYDILESGKTVYLEFSATWCGPCWGYHSGNHLKNLYNTYGPNGTDEVFVMFIEGDLNTNTACLYGPSGCSGGTQGNWVTGTPFPIVDLNPSTIGVRYDYQIAYWPTIYSICPQTKKVYESGQRSTQGQYEFVSSCGMTYSLDGVGDASCNDFSDGYVHISPNGGFGPYTYNWSNGNSNQNLNNVPAGTYSCTFRDKNNVEIETSTYQVNEPPAIFLDTDAIETETCPGYADGAVLIDVYGGSGGFTYEWSNGSQNQNLSDVNGGTYNVVVTDSDGCTETETFIVPVNPLPAANAGVDGVLTCDFPWYTIDGTDSENFGASYLWTTVNGNIVSGANTLTPVVDEPGDYELTVTYFATGCFATDEASVADEKVSPITDAGPPGLVDCVQFQDTLDGSNSQGGGGYTYLWTTTDGNILSGASTPHPIVNAQGTYILRVTNQGTGCFGLDTTNVVLGPQNQLPTSDYDNVITNLIVQFNHNAGGNPTGYSWTFGDGGSSTNQNPTHIYQTEGTYNVCLVVTNACGEDSYCSEVTVAAGSMSAAVINVTEATCNHHSQNGAVDVEVSGGLPDYTYVWSNGATTQDLADIPPGNYSVTVTDSDNQVVILNVVVGYQYLVNIDDALSEEPACFGEASGVIALNTSSTGGNLDYSWSHDPILNNSVANGLSSGSYTVVVSDQNGCTDEIEVVLNQPDLLEAILEIYPSQQGQNNGSANLQPTGGTPPYNAVWSNGAQGLSVQDLAPAEYDVVLKDANGCDWTITFRIEETVSIGTIPSLSSWSLLPNPSQGHVWLNVAFTQSETATVRVLNVLGGVMFQRDFTGNVISEQLALSHLSKGTYMVEVRTATGRIVQTLIIQ